MHSPKLTIATFGPIDCGGLIRSLTEQMDFEARLISLTGSQDLVDFLTEEGRDTGEALVLCGAHGDLPAQMFPQPTPNWLNGQIVISTDPDANQLSFANAILNSGGSAHIGVEVSIPASDTALFLHIFLHEILVQRSNVETAMIKAHGYADAFTLYMT